MSSIEDYYKTLGVPKKASDAEIKKAYKKLAMKWHPDKHMKNGIPAKKKAEDTFKKVTEAYEVLNDPEKKKVYDEFGNIDMNTNVEKNTTSSTKKTTVKKSNSTSTSTTNNKSKSGDIVQLLSSIPGMEGIANMFDTVNVNINGSKMTLREMMGGKSKNDSVPNSSSNSQNDFSNFNDIFGTGFTSQFDSDSNNNYMEPDDIDSDNSDNSGDSDSDDNSDDDSDDDSDVNIKQNNKNNKNTKSNSSNIYQSYDDVDSDNDDMIKPSNPYTVYDDAFEKGDPIHIDLDVTLEELYSGVTKKVKVTRKIHPDPTKKNKKIKEENLLVDIPILAGWKDEREIVIDNMGDIKSGVEPGDLVVILQEVKHDVFTRTGDNLIATLDITLDEALTGIKKKIKGVDKKQIIINLPKGIERSSHTHTIKGKGMPIRRSGGIVGYGDLIVKFDVQLKE